MQETKEREKRISEHVKDVNKQRQAEKKAEDDVRAAEKQKWVRFLSVELCNQVCQIVL